MKHHDSRSESVANDGLATTQQYRARAPANMPKYKTPIISIVVLCVVAACIGVAAILLAYALLPFFRR